MPIAQMITFSQIAVAIAKESTNAASELTLREGLRFEKRMFQVGGGKNTPEISQHFPFFWKSREQKTL